MRTTKGYQLCVLWVDYANILEDLNFLKESNPVEVAEYASSNGLLAEPAFACWAPAILKQRERIIKAIKCCYHKCTHKLGIRASNSIVEALQLDLDSGTTFWKDAIDKEMKNVMPAFHFLEERERVPVWEEEEINF